MTVVFGAKGDDGKKLSRGLMAAAVRSLWGWQEVPELERGAKGKPEFSGVTGRWMSLSHSGGYALCALSDDGPVGVDIETVRPHRERLPAYVMNETELAEFDGSWEEFCRIWTLKESRCKRDGEAIFPPRRIQTPPDCPWAGFAGEGWRAAVCCSGPAPKEIRWIEGL